ncbi:MAG TPA: tetratricopeptide repeat protein [Ilumatobacter sp.]|nr:tetratricopeptide repeat protein [Ilumatobacter sp.]
MPRGRVVIDALPVGIDGVIEQLVAWRRAAGSPSYAEIARRIQAERIARGATPASAAVAKTTVYDCFRGDRRRLDVELVVEVASALGLPDDELDTWANACWAAQHRAEASRVVSVRATLPAPVERFVGRVDEAARLLTGEPAIFAIVGMAGTGKTQLATRVAHKLMARGDVARAVFVDLRGFDAERPPADPTAVVDAVVRALGTDPRALGNDRPGRRTALGELLADERALLVLDDAAGPEQVAEIVPIVSAGRPAVPMVVTSRVALGDVPGVVPVPLAPFDDAEALALLDPDLVGDAPDAAREVVALAGHLPLAVGIVASRIAARPGWTLADHARVLRQHREQFRLDEPVRAAIDLSYQALSQRAQRTLRLLAVQPCSLLDRLAVAAMIGESDDAAEALLDELQAAHVVSVADDGRMGLHALVRAHAAGLAIDEDRPSDRDEAIGRLDEYMVAQVWAATGALSGERVPTPRYPVAAVEPPATPETAGQWLDSEHENLLTLAAPGREHRRPTIAIELSEALAKHLERRGLHYDAVMLHERALATATDLGDSVGERLALLHLGQMLVRLGDAERATRLLGRAAAAADAAGDPDTSMRAINTLGIVDARAGRLDAALEQFEQALELARQSEAGDTVAIMLDNIAVVQRRLGRLDDAARLHRQAHEQAVAGGIAELAANSLMNLSDVLLAQGDAPGALDAAQRARDACREGGFVPTEAYAITNIGLALVALGRATEGIAEHETALDLARPLGNRSLEVAVLNNLGEALIAADRRADAEVTFKVARELAITIDDAFERDRADEVLVELARG